MILHKVEVDGHKWDFGYPIFLHNGDSIAVYYCETCTEVHAVYHGKVITVKKAVEIAEESYE